MTMKKSMLAYLGVSALVSQANVFVISENPMSEKDKRKRQYQQELEDEYLQLEYDLIQKKESKLSLSQRRRVVVMYQKRFGVSE
jgi:hypothetical protein